MRRRHQLAVAFGAIAALATLLPPAADLSGRFLAIHMLRQMLLLTVAAPALAYGWAPLTNRRPKIHPVVGIFAFNAAVLSAQLPVVVRTVSSSLLLDVAAQLVFLLCSLSLWLPVVASPAVGGLSRIAKIGYLLVAGVPPTIPGVVLAFSRRPLYAGYQLSDQQLAGLLLFGTAKFALIGGTFLILWRMLSPEADPPDDDHGQPARPEAPPSAPAWLSRLDEDLPAEPAAPRRVPVTNT